MSTSDHDSYRVECVAPAGKPGALFTDLGWDHAVARCESERVKPWVRVSLVCEKTGAEMFVYPGAALEMNP